MEQIGGYPSRQIRFDGRQAPTEPLMYLHPCPMTFQAIAHVGPLPPGAACCCGRSSGCLWWPMFVSAWFAVNPEYAGMEVMASMACYAAAYGLAFYLTVALPVYWAARRRRRWRPIPIVTSAVYIASGALLSWSFAAAFAIVVAAMLVTELNAGSRFHRQVARWRDYIVGRLAERWRDRGRASGSDRALTQGAASR